MSSAKEWKFKALLHTVESIVFEYADRPTMNLKYHNNLQFSVIGDDFFPKTGPMNCWKIREHYGKCCVEDDPEGFRTDFLEDYHPFVHIYVHLPNTAPSFIEWLKELGDVPKDADENEWPE
jgi:hypothetical protein